MVMKTAHCNHHIPALVNIWILGTYGKAIQNLVDNCVEGETEWTI